MKKANRISFSFTGAAWLHFCGNCECPIEIEDKYCPECGIEIVEDNENVLGIKREYAKEETQ